MIQSTFTGAPPSLPAPGVTADIKRSLLQYEAQPVANAYKWETFLPFVAQDFGGAGEKGAEDGRRAAVLESINADATAAHRARLLGALGVAGAVSLSGYGAEDFLIPPQIEAANS